MIDNSVNMDDFKEYYDEWLIYHNKELGNILPDDFEERLKIFYLKTYIEAYFIYSGRAIDGLIRHHCDVYFANRMNTAFYEAIKQLLANKDYP